MPIIYIDSDACPVKDEVYRVAGRYGIPVRVVSNQYQRVPSYPRIEAVLVEQGSNKADDWIFDHCERGDIVISSDIPLAARCLEKGARVLGHKGREFTSDSIGNALASRMLADYSRQMGIAGGGPSAMSGRDRSLFLSKLDTLVNAVLRNIA